VGAFSNAKTLSIMDEEVIGAQTVLEAGARAAARHTCAYMPKLR
jgi:hypothetical protein